jgi:hypothetical protein
MARVSLAALRLVLLHGPSDQELVNAQTAKIAANIYGAKPLADRSAAAVADQQLECGRRPLHQPRPPHNDDPV